MMRRADAAMYEAKRRGRNLVSARSESEKSPDKNKATAELEHLGFVRSA
jgi:hypothetical protein